MALYVYAVADGSLVSWCAGDNDPVAPDEVLAARGLAAVRGLPPLDETHAWDASTKTVIEVTAPSTPKLIPTFEFILSFTAAENAAIRASSDPNVQHLLFALTVAQQIDLNSTTIEQGVGYLAAIGLLTQDRAAAILAGAT